MPKSSVQVFLEKIALKKKPPVETEIGQVYEVDELYALSMEGSALLFTRSTVLQKKSLLMP
jgi:hypothetical protein